MDPATADLWSTAGCEIALQSYESHDEAQWVMECWIPELPLELNDSRLEGHSRSDERRDAKCRALSVVPDSHPIGQVVSRYRIVQKIGGGGIGSGV